jgi:hypothetical protein
VCGRRAVMSFRGSKSPADEELTRAERSLRARAEATSLIFEVAGESKDSPCVRTETDEARRSRGTR